MQTIYALTEPTGEIRYVGRTAKIEGRLLRHMGLHNITMGELNDWIRRTLASGAEPGVITLAIVPDDGADEWERHFIRYHHVRSPLLNRVGIVAGDSIGLRKFQSMVAPAPGGWSQADLALALGVSQQGVSAWVHGKNRPRRDALSAIERLLGIPTSDWTIADAA